MYLQMTYIWALERTTYRLRKHEARCVMPTCMLGVSSGAQTLRSTGKFSSHSRITACRRSISACKRGSVMVCGGGGGLRYRLSIISKAISWRVPSFAKQLESSEWLKGADGLVSGRAVITGRPQQVLTMLFGDVYACVSAASSGSYYHIPMRRGEQLTDPGSSSKTRRSV